MGKFSNIITCLKYPFLYPRNRCTGLHYNNWGLLEWIDRKKSESSLYIHLSLTEGDVSGKETYQLGSGKCLTLEIHGSEVWIVLGKPGGSLERVVSKLKVPSKILGVSWGDREGEVRVKVSKLPEEPRFISSKIIHKPLTWIGSKIVKWFHSWPLQIFHCLPGYTELDALPEGWRKAFGENLCRELRKAIIKESGLRGLFRFRVVQIKEKFGYLHFYYNNGWEKVGGVISKYEEISERTCICCGKPATWRTTGWISPYCDDCIGPNDPYETAERIKEEEGN